MITSQLQKEEFRFVLLKKKEKIPFEVNWTKQDYKHDDERLKKWLELGNNYGIIGGFGSLIILDFDDEKVQNEIVPHLPQTFTVTTGSGGLHKYFICDEPKSFKVLDKDKNTLIDIQGEGKQVVCPGSIHPNGNIYTVTDNSPIAKISLKRIKILLDPYLKERDKFVPDYPQDNIIQRIKDKVQLTQVMQSKGYDLTSNPTMCKLGHDSKGGKCFSYNDTTGLWNCFHCDEGGDLISFVMHHENCDFRTAKTKLMEVAGIKMNISDAASEFREDYVLMAEKFHEHQPFFYDKARMWWYWNYAKTCWELTDKTNLMSEIEKVLKGSSLKVLSNGIKSQIISALEIVGRRNIPKDIPKNWVQFKDRIYDLKTGAIYHATPDFFNTNPISYELGDSKETPLIDEIFRSWVTKEEVETLYDIIAYSMLQDYPLHRIFCLVGSGSNGKSCFLNLLEKLLGKNNCSTTELEGLLERFGSSVVFKKLLCVMGETNFNQLKKTSLLKRLSGGDSIDFEFKGKDRFIGNNYATLLIATNNLPTTSDMTDGFYRRWIIVKFPNKFDEKIDILETIPVEEMQNLCLKSLYNLKRIINDRNIRGEGNIEERKIKYESNSNPIRKFIEEFCDVHPDLKTPGFLFRDKLKTFFEKGGYRVMSEGEITRAMREEGFDIKLKQVDEKYPESEPGKRWKHYLGLDFKTDSLKRSDTLDTLDTLKRIEIPVYRKPIETSVSSVSSVSLSENTTSSVGENQKTQHLVEKEILDFISREKDSSFEEIKENFDLSDNECNVILSRFKSKALIFEFKSGFYKKL